MPGEPAHFIVAKNKENSFKIVIITHQFYENISIFYITIGLIFRSLHLEMSTCPGNLLIL